MKPIVIWIVDRASALMLFAHGRPLIVSEKCTLEEYLRGAMAFARELRKDLLNAIAEIAESHLRYAEVAFRLAKEFRARQQAHPLFVAWASSNPGRFLRVAAVHEHLPRQERPLCQSGVGWTDRHASSLSLGPIGKPGVDALDDLWVAAAAVAVRSNRYGRTIFQMKPEPARIFPHLDTQIDDLVKARRTRPLANHPRPVNPYFTFGAVKRDCYFSAHQPEKDPTRNEQGEETQSNPERRVQVVSKEEYGKANGNRCGEEKSVYRTTPSDHQTVPTILPDFHGRHELCCGQSAIGWIGGNTMAALGLGQDGNHRLHLVVCAHRRLEA
jgi:hypothetical protein